MDTVVRLLNWRLKLVEIKEIPLYLHSSFVLLFGTLMLMLWLPSIALTGPYAATVKVLSTFAPIIVAYSSVILHEYGHALTAKHLGYVCREITMFPFGGLASIGGNWHDNWRHQFWITLMGPMVNVVIALLAMPFAIVYPDTVAFTILEINVILLVFNLLPFYPMDGGRLMASFLLGTMDDPIKATKLTRQLTIAFMVVGLPIVWFVFSPVAAIIIFAVAGLMGGAESRHVTSNFIAKQSKSGGQLAQHAEEWKAVVEADAKQLFPDDPDKQENYVASFEKFQEWMGRVYLILASRSSGPEEVRAKAAKLMDCLKSLPDEERLSFNTLYLQLGEEEEDNDFKRYLTERFLEKHQLI